MSYTTAAQLVAELRAIAREQPQYRISTKATLNQAADRLERYNELFKWTNENCAACGEGKPLPHAQPLPDPQQSDKTVDNG